MKNIFNASVCALSVIVALTGSVFSAESTEVRVIGTIQPASCSPEVTGSGVFDYGITMSKELQTDNYNPLGTLTRSFSITCDARAKVALKAINGRPGTVSGGTDTPVSGVDASAMGVTGTAVGLGMNGSSSIGGYVVQINNVQADTGSGPVAVDTISDGGSSGATWGTHSSGDMYSTDGSVRLLSWAESGNTTPVAFNTLTGNIDVTTFINHSSALDLTSTIALDGLTTIEIVYL